MTTTLNHLQDKRTIHNSSWSGRFDVTSDLTDSTLGLYTMTYEAGSAGAAPHYHKKMLEIFNVLEGAISVLINNEWRTVKAGDTVIIPTMTIHGFTPLQDQRCTIQILFSPNIRREEFFLDFNKYAQVSDQEKYEFWARYDQHPPETHPLFKKQEPS